MKLNPDSSANVSHDLRSPLSLIMGNLEMLQEDEDVVLTPGAIKNLETGYKTLQASALSHG